MNLFAVLVKFISFQHLVFAFKLSVPQLFQDLNIFVCELVHIYLFVAISVQFSEDLISYLGGVFFGHSSVHKVVLELVRLYFAISIEVNFLKDFS